MTFKRGQTYSYKFCWSIKQSGGTSQSFLIRRSARTTVATEAKKSNTSTGVPFALEKFIH